MNATAGIGSPTTSAAMLTRPVPVAAKSSNWTSGTTSASGAYTSRLRGRAGQRASRGRPWAASVSSADSAQPRALRRAASTAVGPPAIDRADSVTSGGVGTSEIAGTPNSRSRDCCGASRSRTSVSSSRAAATDRACSLAAVAAARRTPSSWRAAAT